MVSHFLFTMMVMEKVSVKVGAFKYITLSVSQGFMPFYFILLGTTMMIMAKKREKIVEEVQKGCNY